jgi:hypothetical protein
MSDPNWISAANALLHPESVLSKIRADFGAEASNRSADFRGTLNHGENGI